MGAKRDSRASDADPVDTPGEDKEAAHISLRKFRKTISKIARGEDVVVVGANAGGFGLFIPLHCSRYSGHDAILAEARRTLRKIKTIDRYRPDKGKPGSF